MIGEAGRITVWAIAAAAAAGVVVRPFRLPEALWACTGAALALGLGLLPWSAGLAAVGEGADVYLFLIGMMLLSEIARREGLFDWLAVEPVDPRLARHHPVADPDPARGRGRGLLALPEDRSRGHAARVGRGHRGEATGPPLTHRLAQAHQYLFMANVVMHAR